MIAGNLWSTSNVFVESTPGGTRNDAELIDNVFRLKIPNA